VKVTVGPFAGQFGLYAGMKPHQRVEVLLTLLGGQQRVSLRAKLWSRRDCFVCLAIMASATGIGAATNRYSSRHHCRPCSSLS
jgi:hypothetical protein